MSSEVRSHRDLRAWQLAFELALRVHELAGKFPRMEQFALTDQIRRASLSVSCNIAEGYGRGQTKDYARFLRMARGSLYEVDTQLCFALRFGYLDQETFQDMQQKIQETGKVLGGLLKAIHNASTR